MAVVFISPKQRQKMFFVGITVLFLLTILIVSLGVFVFEPKGETSSFKINKPKINIDMGVFETEQFHKLKNFTLMENRYSYVVTTKDGKQKEGFITALTIDDAKADLESQGYTVNEIKEAEIGRDNPFTPYYGIDITK